MAAKPASLGDFFNAKKKKVVKASNLNNTTTSSKTDKEAAKPLKKDANEEGWEEEVAVVPTMKVDTAGKLLPLEEKKEDEEAAAPVWGAVRGPKSSEPASAHIVNDRKFPTLAKSVQSTNINIDDGSDAKVNISTVKNHFAALNEGDEDDEDASKRPKEIKPAMVTKKKGERETTAIKREVDKYVPGSEKDDADAPPAAVHDKKKKKDKKEKAAEEENDDEAKGDGDKADSDQEDVKMAVDQEASKAKYKGRKKLAKKEIPREELEEEKENRPVSKKKLAVVEDF